MKFSENGQSLELSINGGRCIIKGNDFIFFLENEKKRIVVDILEKELKSVIFDEEVKLKKLIQSKIELINESAVRV